MDDISNLAGIVTSLDTSDLLLLGFAGLAACILILAFRFWKNHKAVMDRLDDQHETIMEIANATLHSTAAVNHLAEVVKLPVDRLWTTAATRVVASRSAIERLFGDENESAGNSESVGSQSGVEQQQAVAAGPDVCASVANQHVAGGLAGVREDDGAAEHS